MRGNGRTQKTANTALYMLQITEWQKKVKNVGEKIDPLSPYMKTYVYITTSLMFLCRIYA